MYIFACAVTHLVLVGKESGEDDGGVPHMRGEGSRSFVDAIRKSPSSIVVIVICFFSIWSIIGLTGFHTYLTSTNLTTNEDIKGSYSSKRSQENFNPFSRGGLISNCLDVLCSPVNPSLIDAQGVVTEQYLTANNLSLQLDDVGGGGGGVGGLASHSSVGGGSSGVPSSSHSGMSGAGVVQTSPLPRAGAASNYSVVQPVVGSNNGQVVPVGRSYGSVGVQNEQQQHQQQPVNGHHNNHQYVSQQQQLQQHQGERYELQSELSTRNVTLHNDRLPVHARPDLDQTTMIGSALDLDSLDGGEDEEDQRAASTVVSSSAASTGSQVGLIAATTTQQAAVANAV